MKRRTVSPERGQEMVEFALTASVLFLVILGILDIGRLVYYWSALEYATRVGARFGIVQPNDTTAIEDTVLGAAVAVPLQREDVNVELLDMYADTDGNDTIRISVDYPFDAVSPVIGFILGADRSVTAQSTMRLEK